MDVICNGCSTEYEFEEALVSLRGTAVKCTQCGHLFKVQRASPSVPETTCWTIRRADGEAHTLADLSELPRRIRDGSFARDDELSRTGKLWRRLGDIDELDEHFDAADRRGPSRGPLPMPLVSSDEVPSVPHKAEQRDSVHAVESYRTPGIRNESRTRAWARLLTSAAIVAAIAIWFFSLPPSGDHWSRALSSTSARAEHAAAVSDPVQRAVDAAASALAPQAVDHFAAALVPELAIPTDVAHAEPTLLSRGNPGAADAEPTAKTSELAGLVARGRSQLQAGQLTAAKRTFEHALTLQPDAVSVHAGLGQVAIARGRHVQAIDHLVAAALAGDAESLLALADTYRKLGRQHEALAAYQSYLQQNPHGPQLDLAKLQIERLSEQLAAARKP